MLCGLLLGLSTGLQAQELQTSFERLEKDLYARTHERLDLNDVPCAVLRVSVPDAKEFTFSGNIIGVTSSAFWTLSFRNVCRSRSFIS